LSTSKLIVLIQDLDVVWSAILALFLVGQQRVTSAERMGATPVGDDARHVSDDDTGTRHLFGDTCLLREQRVASVASTLRIPLTTTSMGEQWCNAARQVQMACALRLICADEGPPGGGVVDDDEIGDRVAPLLAASGRTPCRCPPPSLKPLHASA
jgi:hypothetical protein